MKLIIYSVCVLIQSISCVASEQTAKAISIVNFSNADFSAMNNSGEMVLSGIGETYNDEYGNSYDTLNHYYTNMELKNALICITDLVSSELSSLGYAPIQQSDKKHSIYNINMYYNDSIDRYGNVLISFFYSNNNLNIEKFCCNKQSYFIYPCKLGVWHKERGFKVLEIPKIEYVQINEIYFKDDFMVVRGFDKNYKYLSVVLSIENGYFGERIKHPL